jgi:hypothetical protein
MVDPMSARVDGISQGRCYERTDPGASVTACRTRSKCALALGCHWSLDVTYREDESRIRDKHLRENFAWLNRFTLSLLKQHPGRESLAMKRRCCGWSERFLLKVLAGATL